jgi:hypothetical protein
MGPLRARPEDFELLQGAWSVLPSLNAGVLV